MWRAPKVFLPKYSEVRIGAPSSAVAMGSVRTSRSVISRSTAPRGGRVGDVMGSEGLAGKRWQTLLQNVRNVVEKVQKVQTFDDVLQFPVKKLGFRMPKYACAGRNRLRTNA